MKNIVDRKIAEIRHSIKNLTESELTNNETFLIDEITTAIGIYGNTKVSICGNIESSFKNVITSTVSLIVDCKYSDIFGMGLSKLILDCYCDYIGYDIPVLHKNSKTYTDILGILNTELAKPLCYGLDSDILINDKITYTNNILSLLRNMDGLKLSYIVNAIDKARLKIIFNLIIANKI